VDVLLGIGVVVEGAASDDITGSPVVILDSVLEGRVSTIPGDGGDSDFRIGTAGGSGEGGRGESS